MKRSSQQTFNNACDSQRSRQLTLRAVSVPKITVDLLTPCHEKFTILILSSLYALFRLYLNHLTPTGSVLNYYNFFFNGDFIPIILFAESESEQNVYFCFIGVTLHIFKWTKKKKRKKTTCAWGEFKWTDSFIYFTENTRTQSCHINAKIGVTLKERWPPRTTTSDLRPSQSPSYWSHTPALNQEHCINTHTNQQFSAKYPLGVFLPDVTQLYIPCVVILFFFPDLVSVFSVVFFFILVLSLI